MGALTATLDGVAGPNPLSLQGIGGYFMRKLMIAPLLLAAAVPAAPALADVPYAVTPSGRTEAYFDMPVVGTSDRIANGCADNGWTLVNSTPTVVTCELPVSTMQGILAALTMGNRYSTPPRNYIRFNIAGSGSSSRVQASGWIETQMAFGQVRTQEMDGAHYHNNAMALLTNLDGRYPPGTTFPNHAYFGNQFENADNAGVVITSVEARSPADRAGMKSGDLLTRIAKEKIKHGGNLLDGMRHAVKAETFDVEVMRAGAKMKLTLPREYRADIVGPAFVEAPPTEAPALAQQIVPLSPADELAKFAKLKADGVITEEEFASQKKRLLGGG